MPADDPLGRLGSLLAEHGFAESRLERALAGDAFLSPLVELFTLGLPVASDAVERALPPVPLSELEREGVVRAHGGMVTAPLRITPWRGLLLLHDPWGEAALRHDYVGGPNDAAQTLAELTVRRPVGAALDVGTGCGVQALLACRHAESVVATDINPRAVAVARLNVRLNGVSNVECVQGDLFEPVAGDRFDLVVANPPYVVSPDSDLLFRDSGLGPGEVCAKIAAGAAEHLTDGGYACVLANWPTGPSDDRWDAPRSWASATGCDACAFSYGPEAPLAYAARWTEPPASPDAAAHAQTVRRWLEFYEQRGIESIWFGAVILRRRAGVNWFAGVELTSEGAGSGSDQIVRIFEAHDFLQGSSELAHSRFEPAPGSRLTHVLEHDGDGFSLAQASVTLADGIGAEAAVDPLAVHVLARLDGRRSLDELFDAVAAERGLERGLLAERSLASVRRLFELGLLTRRPD